jgi:putative colanic acid biosynthesis UDP-glucose lipid carrier transferase
LFVYGLGGDFIFEITARKKGAAMEQHKEIIHPYQSEISFFYRLIDAFLIIAALRLALIFYGLGWTYGYFVASVPAVFFFYLFGESLQIYRSWRGAVLIRQLQPVLLSWILTVFALLLLAYMTKTTATYSRVVIGLWLLGAPLLLVVWRMVVRDVLKTLRLRGMNSRSVAIAGAKGVAVDLVQLIQNTPSLGFNLRGVFDEGGSECGDSAPADSSMELSGDFQDMIARTQNNEFDLVYIALPLRDESRIRELISKLSDTTASIYVVPDFFVFELLQLRLLNVGWMPVISLFETPFIGVDGWVKRLEDILLSSIILALVALPMLLIAASVKLTSPGPVLFKQKRYGLDGRAIRVWKFRSMTVCEDAGTVPQATRCDPRVTPLGAFLRATSLDELPQFFNVLMGDMSVVGPRPHAVAHNEQYRKLIPGYMLRHKVKPGITGWAQVNGWRGETDTLEKMQKRVECDLWYIRSWSIWLDLKIIFKTLYKGFVGQNVY